MNFQIISSQPIASTATHKTIAAALLLSLMMSCFSPPPVTRRGKLLETGIVHCGIDLSGGANNIQNSTEWDTNYKLYARLCPFIRYGLMKRLNMGIDMKVAVPTGDLGLNIDMQCGILQGVTSISLDFSAGYAVSASPYPEHAFILSPEILLEFPVPLMIYVRAPVILPETRNRKPRPNIEVGIGIPLQRFRDTSFEMLFFSFYRDFIRDISNGLLGFTASREIRRPQYIMIDE